MSLVNVSYRFKKEEVCLFILFPNTSVMPVMSCIPHCKAPDTFWLKYIKQIITSAIH